MIIFITKKPIRLPSPVLISTKPKKSAGIRVHRALLVNPEKTFGAGTFIASVNIKKKKPETELGMFSGLNIHSPIVIIIASNTRCPCAGKSGTQGLASPT
ncbi:MAG: hypothetical protein BWY65_02114 [Firmicutes bacterium ADurb.Bin373]|nr:MAG: hypothetical protein BWY65_02114 [Firmicutes bacterium ADurb.Bin373]